MGHSDRNLVKDLLIELCCSRAALSAALCGIADFGIDKHFGFLTAERDEKFPIDHLSALCNNNQINCLPKPKVR
jgi:hypothetical protein